MLPRFTERRSIHRGNKMVFKDAEEDAGAWHCVQHQEGQRDESGDCGVTTTVVMAEGYLRRGVQKRILSDGRGAQVPL